MGSVVPDTTEFRAKRSERRGYVLFKIAINKCRDTACRVRSQSTSNLCKIAIKQVGLRYNHHQYKNTLKGLYFKAQSIRAMKQMDTTQNSPVGAKFYVIACKSNEINNNPQNQCHQGTRTPVTPPPHSVSALYTELLFQKLYKYF